MRMFLVGMCDIFLLLYLTTLAEMDARPTSSLTVQDYVALRSSKEEVSRRAEMKERALSQSETEISRLKQRLEEVLAERARTQSELERLLKEAAGTAVSAKETERAARELAEREAAAREQLAKAAEELRALRESETLQMREVQEARAAKEQIAGELERRESATRIQVSELERTLKETEEAEAAREREVEESRRLAEEARLKAERAALDASEARKQAEEANRLRAEAEAETAAAKNSAVSALARAQHSESEAIRARMVADASAREAEQARAASEKARSRISGMTQPVREAFSKNIASRIRPLEVEIRREGIFGEGTDRLVFNVIPSEYEGEALAFVPLDQLGLDDLDSPSELKVLRATIGGKKARAVYLIDAPFRLVGFSFEGDNLAARPLRGNFPSYMPTLIAIRNGAPLRFRDRVRGVNEEHFFFPRDRLSLQPDQSLKFTSEGFRGTGDFSEHIVKGDQIVDLEGNFLGVAGDTNSIYPIPDLRRWERVDLGRSGVAEAAAKMLERHR